MVQAVIFDMNGVIIDDEHIHELAFREVLKPFSIDLSHEKYLTCFAGRTDSDGFVEVEKLFTITLPIKELLNQKMDMYLNLFPKNKKTYPGVIELINSLSNKFILALTSSSTRREIDLITQEFGVYEKFKIIVSAEDVTQGKPDPQPYLITSERLGINPDQCVVIEDSASGVKSAITAGMKCIGITTTHTTHDLQQATKVVDTFDQITKDIIISI